MELDIKKLATMIPLTLNIVTKIDLEDEELHFVYGQEEYTKDVEKVKKQFKRQLKKTFRLWH
jgi:hypothetical protein